jgi:hypothetical protein
MARLAIFAAGFISGWLALGWGIRQVRLKELEDVTATMSGPDGEWEIRGALVRSPWNKRRG